MFFVRYLKTVTISSIILILYFILKHTKLHLYSPDSTGAAESRSFYFQNETVALDIDQTEMRSFIREQDLHTYDPYSLKVPLPFLSDYKNPCFVNEHAKIYCLPYFFLLASQKSGTTDLWNKLQCHPQIAFGQKEYHWWNRGRFPLLIKNTNLTFAQYMDWYNASTKAISELTVDSNQTDKDHHHKPYHPMIFGDGTASMLYDQLQWRRLPQNDGLKLPNVITAHTIRYILPSAKFVVILRNPSKRLFSDYCYYNSLWADPNKFHQMVETAIAWFHGCQQYRNRSCIYDPPEHVHQYARWHPDMNWDPIVRLRASLYSEFLIDWLKIFDREQFYFFTLEEYSANRLYYMNEIYTFLGLHTLKAEGVLARKLGVVNFKTNCSISLHNKTKELLDHFYRPFNIKLARLLNDDKFLWQND